MFREANFPFWSKICHGLVVTKLRYYLTGYYETRYFKYLNLKLNRYDLLQYYKVTIKLKIVKYS